MKKTIFIFLVFLSMATFAQNIAFVSQEKLLAALPNYLNLEKEKSALIKGFDEELKKESDATNTKIDALLKPYEVKPDEKLETLKARMKAIDADKLDLLVDEDKLTQKKKAAYEKQISDFVTTKMTPLLTKLNSSIESYSSKNKIDVVYILEKLSPGLAYFNKKKDITEEIIKMIK